MKPRLTKIEAGHYRCVTASGLSFDVYRCVGHVCTDRALKHPNRWGSYTSASSRRDVWWNVRIGDRVVGVGYGSRAHAVAGALADTQGSPEP